ncbi:hypothetical protein SPJ221_188 [Staphylococcus phage vB_SauH_SPJ2]|nr:hypothetical protein SPJ221_5 [Staphylococcus phage vB_SauH_SPJ2]WEW53737.1 hypothetical protein SPJ221_188 [Staphylococcus phage vB_SauH_SPJ2]
MLSFILVCVALGISELFLLTILGVILVISIKDRDIVSAIFAIVVFIIMSIFISASVLRMLGM